MLGFAAVIGPGGVVDKAKSDDLAFHLTLTRLLTLFSVLLRSTYSLRASDCASPSSLRQLVRELGGKGGGGGIMGVATAGTGGRVPPVQNSGGTPPEIATFEENFRNIYQF